MKRAVVWKGFASGLWHVDTTDGSKPMRCRRFRTYPAALAHALHEVGLTPTNPEEQS